MEPSCSRSEASDVVGMAPSCSQSDPQTTLQTTEKKSKHGIEHDRARRTAETAEQKEHRLSKPRTKDRARRAGHAAAEVVSRSHTQIIALESYR